MGRFTIRAQCSKLITNNNITHTKYHSNNNTCFNSFSNKWLGHNFHRIKITKSQMDQTICINSLARSSCNPNNLNTLLSNNRCCRWVLKIKTKHKVIKISAKMIRRLSILIRNKLNQKVKRKNARITISASAQMVHNVKSCTWRKQNLM